MARTRAPLRRRPRLTPRHSASGRPHGELLLASPSSRLFQVTKIALRHFSYQGGRAFVAGTGTPTRLVLTLRLSGRGTTRVEDSTTRRMRQSRRRPRTAPRRLQAHPPAHTPLLSASGRRPTTGTPTRLVLTLRLSGRGTAARRRIRAGRGTPPSRTSSRCCHPPRRI